MGYLKATDVLPKDVVEEVQKYVDGELLYFPRKKNYRRKWGDTTGIKETLSVRNLSIYKDYMNGMNLKTLSDKYFLTPKSIGRIVRNEKIKMK